MKRPILRRGFSMRVTQRQAEKARKTVAKLRRELNYYKRAYGLLKAEFHIQGFGVREILRAKRIHAPRSFQEQT